MEHNIFGKLANLLEDSNGIYSDLNIADWAKKLYKLPSGTYSYEPDFPFIEDILKTASEHVVIIKASQMGLTEALMVVAFYELIVKRNDVFFLFPTDKVASDWSAGRFSGALRRTKILREQFTSYNNVGHKQVGNCNFYCRGSNSAVSLENLPIDILIIDEFDRMHRATNEGGSTDFDSISLARSRLNASLNPRQYNNGTPTIPDYGISAEIEKSTDNRWNIRCPCCSKFFYPEFPQNVQFDERDSSTAKYYCHLCSGTFSHTEMKATKGIWVPSNPSATVAGFRLPGLASHRMPLYKKIQNYLNALDSTSKMQVFYNNDLGVPYLPVGSGITDEQLENARGEHLAGKIRYPAVMGVDVGSLFHYVLAFEEEGQMVVLDVGSTPHFSELCKIYEDNQCVAAVVDAMPETRKMREFQEEFPGQIYLCWYNLESSKMPIKINEEINDISVNRTEALDTVLGKFRSGKILLPRNITVEFKNHLKALKRVAVETRNGIMFRYVRTSDDHLAHALNYANIALQFSETEAIEIWE